jgi:heptosyltransferase-2
MIGRRERDGALVVQTAYLGNVLLTTPLLSLLASRYGLVDVVAQPVSAQVLDGHPAVKEVIAYDKRGADRGLRGLQRVARHLASIRHERVYLPDRSWRAAMLAVTARIPERIGFAESPAATLYSDRVQRPGHGHETARIAALAGVPAGAPLPPLSLGLTDEDAAAAEAWLANRGVVGHFVAVAPGSVWGARRWPHFPKLAATIERPVVVIGGPADAALAVDVVAAAPERTWNSAGEVGPRVAAALVARALALVSNDSAAIHLATAVGTPVVALFGPTVPSFGFGPLGPLDVVLGRDDLLCRPCAQPGPAVCPLDHHRCLQELPVTTVADALASVLRRVEERRAIHPGN